MKLTKDISFITVFVAVAPVELSSFTISSKKREDYKASKTYELEILGNF